MKHYLKTITLVITLSVAIFFSKQIQDTLIRNYNKSLAFMQKHNNRTVSPLGF